MNDGITITVDITVVVVLAIIIATSLDTVGITTKFDFILCFGLYSFII